MGPADVVIPTEQVKVSDSGSLAVRGISPNDAMQLYHRHSAPLSVLFKQFADKIKAGQPTDHSEVMAASAQMVTGTPTLMAEIIAVAMDVDPEDAVSFDLNVKAIKRWSTGVQMEALQKIAGLTFSTDMPPPKFFGLVLEMARNATTEINALRAA